MTDNLNWLGISDHELEQGLIERNHTTKSLITPESKKRVIPGSVDKIKNLNVQLQSYFKTWWNTGVVEDTQKFHGYSLHNVTLTDYKGNRGVIGGFLNLDHLIKDPDEALKYIGNMSGDYIINEKDSDGFGKPQNAPP